MSTNTLAHRLTPLLLGLVLGGCSAPPPAPGDPEAYMPALAEHLVGVWRVEEPPPRLPWFLSASSRDELEQAFNPPGYEVLEVQPDALQLVVFPSGGDVARRTGQLLVRVTVAGETREYIRGYVLLGNQEGEAWLEIATSTYQVAVGPRAEDLRLVPVQKFASEDEPTLRCHFVADLPGRRDPRQDPPPGVARVD